MKLFMAAEAPDATTHILTFGFTGGCWTLLAPPNTAIPVDADGETGEAGLARMAGDALGHAVILIPHDPGFGPGVAYFVIPAGGDR